MRSCSDWTWSTFAIIQAEQLGVSHDVPQRVATGLAHADLRESPPELVRQRPLELLDDLAEGGVEPEAGPDGDRQQVEGVRDHQEDGLLALLDAPTKPELRDRVAQERPDDAESCPDREREAQDADDREQEEEQDPEDDGRDGLDAEPV